MTDRIVKANIKRQAEGIKTTAERNFRALAGAMSGTLAMTVYTDKAVQRMPRKMQTGSGSPSLCWMCLRQKQRAPGKGLGLFYFNVVLDRHGAEHRVHGTPCTQDAFNDGARLKP